ncbi:hypothetical protein PF006_g19 [Phytophthora fragariae]|uniref:Uncharacterized protein n=1 Tax=Phytophthora fragariae TaxID=53985 RepID=A0A6A3UVX0_9STRA|nr:hypothetical protein PF006_g19 [Phytophthora fragariae]
MRTEANARSTAPTGAHRPALVSLPMTCSVGRALALDSLSMASTSDARCRSARRRFGLPLPARCHSRRCSCRPVSATCCS